MPADERGLNIVFEADDVRLHDVESDRPFVTYRKNGAALRMSAISSPAATARTASATSAIPHEKLKIFERNYPFGWLGILADVPPVHHELIYCNHENGFALASMRSPHRSRCYLQCVMDERLEDWPDERFWDEFVRRLGPEAGAHVTRGPRSRRASSACAASSPSRCGMAGCFSWAMPRTSCRRPGAKGMNLAVSDAVMLSEALEEFDRSGSQTALNAYSARALPRVESRAVRLVADRVDAPVSRTTDRSSGGCSGPSSSTCATRSAAQTAFAENYVGLPLV